MHMRYTVEETGRSERPPPAICLYLRCCSLGAKVETQERQPRLFFLLAGRINASRRKASLETNYYPRTRGSPSSSLSTHLRCAGSGRNGLNKEWRSSTQPT